MGINFWWYILHILNRSLYPYISFGGVQLKTILKKNILFVFLIIFMIWPLLHFQLVRKNYINPWKLHGWAMYCVADFSLDLKVYGMKKGKKIWIRPKRFSNQTKEKISLYKKYYMYFPGFTKPKNIVSHLFEKFPNIDQLLLEISQKELNKDTARIQLKLIQYRCEKNELGEISIIGKEHIRKHKRSQSEKTISQVFGFIES